MGKNVKNWSANQRKFQIWLALPSDMRDPDTQGEFADVIGVSETTLSRWKALRGWQEAVNQFALEMVGQYVPDVLGSLVKEAVKGSAQHQKMFLDMLGLLVHRVDMTSDGKPLKGYISISPDDWDNDG